MDGKTLTSTKRSNANLALIKYWGKKDENLMIPFCDSISITLDKFYSETTVTYLDQLNEDQVYFNDKLLSNDSDFKIRIIRFMNKFRERYQVNKFAEIKTKNYVPTKVGLASSASGFASLALAASSAYNLNLSKKELSQLARLGSVSASRSIFPNIVLLNSKNTTEFGPDSVEYDKWDDLRIIVFSIYSEKLVSSREAMRLAVNHPNYQSWIDNTNQDLDKLKFHLKNRDFINFGSVIQRNAEMLNQLINDTNLNYLTSESIEVINVINEIQKNFPVYYTYDAGSVVFGITLKQYLDDVLNEINNLTNIKYEVCRVNTE